METSTNVINSVAASAADATLANRILSITGAPSINYLNILSTPVVQRSLVEQAAVKTVVIAAANNTVYSFVARQIIADNENLYPKEAIITYTSDATATTTEISTALKALFDLHNFEITTVATSATTITFTANAGNPLFTLTNISNCTIADAMVTIAPSGTANLAITSVIAPNGTAATAIAGTTTVTVTTLAAHGLMVGDRVTIADVATMTINGAASGTFYIATVPSTTTFTLADCVGAGGANTGTITINTVNTVIVNTLNSSNTLSAGQTVTIASIATMTVNGAASFTGRVRNAVSSTQYYIDGVTNNGSLNSGTITITPVAQASKNLAADLSDVADITAGSTYTSWTFNFASPLAAQASFQARNADRLHTVYVAEGANTGNYPALYTRLNELIAGYLPFSTDFNSETVVL